jgi:multidrug resistance efflux pump
MRFVMCAVALVLTSAAATADEPKPTLPAQPAVPLSPTQLAQLEGEVEAAEAARDGRKAHVKVAELNARAAEINADRVLKLVTSKVVSREEADQAKMDAELARAQLELRLAELKESEVKVKFARKRLEDAKRAGPGQIPNPRARGAADEKAVEELKARLFLTEVRFGESLGEVLRLEAVVAVTEADLARVREAAKRGAVRAGTIDAAEAKVKEAKEQAARARKVHREVVAALAEIHSRLNALQK